MRITQINSFSLSPKAANKLSFKQYFKDYSVGRDGDIEFAIPAQKYLVMNGWGTGRQMTAAQVERELKKSGIINSSDSDEERIRKVNERIDRKF